MCRFLLLKSKKSLQPKDILEAFAQAVKNSPTPQGDKQEDGWGIAWWRENKWHLFKNLNPIWESKHLFNIISPTQFLIVHARSASFEKHKNNVEFNQPFIFKNYSFVFNGFLKGVNIFVPGRFGAEKIWYLVKKNLKNKNPKKALNQVQIFLKKNSKKISALNIGLSDGKKIFAFCYYTQFPQYYQLHYHQSKEISIITSEKINSLPFLSLTSNKLLEL